MNAAVARLVDKPWAIPVFMIAVFGVFLAAMHAFPPAAETRTVVKVCRDGTLILRTNDGEFRVVRPGASGSWPATGPEVCSNTPL
jgi:hypothetical protein